MRDSDIDKLLKEAAKASPSMEPELVNRISRSIASDMNAIRPMASPMLLLSALVVVCGLVAITGASVLGPYGLHKMSAIQASIILSVLASTIVLAAYVSLAESIPGSRRILSPAMLVTVCSAALIAVFVLLFRDYTVERFVAQGIPCLRAGLLNAIPAALGVWWILRRGFRVNPMASAFARGALAGLAGMLMLEIHCANFETLHVIVWHTLVIPVSAALACGTVFRLSKSG
jgi:hypothetical protein